MMRKSTAKLGRAYVGTSGWVYPHWRGPVYPRSLPEDAWLGHYAQRLDSVEINSSFYRLPTDRTLGVWLDAVPEDFAFALKASRYITHMKKLREPHATLPALLACGAALGERLGPILFQLPPRWRVNPERLETFLQTLPKALRIAFEFRDASWLCDDVYGLLRRYGAALCVYDLAGRRSPYVQTADFVYVRLHGPAEAYRGRYSGGVLWEWARLIRSWLGVGLDAYCYFDNDEAGFAFANALQLRGLVEA